MDDVNIIILEHLLVIIITDFNAECLAHLVQFVPGAPANGIHVGVSVFLIDRNELRAEFQAYDAYI